MITLSKLGEKYEDDVLDGVHTKVYRTPYELDFICWLCDTQYRHWWCSDKVWSKLPQIVHKKTICPHCFKCLRKLGRETKRMLKRKR
jgi:hypothetical protein